MPNDPEAQVDVAAPEAAETESGSGAEQKNAVPQPEPQTAEAALHERLTELGLADVTPENAQERALEALSQEREERERIEREYETARPYLAAGQQYYQLTNDPAWQEFQRSRQAPKAAAETKSDARYEPIKFDQRLVDRFYERRINQDTQSEERAWRPDTPPSLRQEYEQAQVSIAERAQAMVNDPAGYFGPLIEQHVERKFADLSQSFESKIQQTQHANSEEQAIAEFETANPWVFELDAISRQPKQDRNTGQPVLSADGYALYGRAADLQRKGLTAEEAIQFAAQERELRLLRAEQTRQQGASAAQETREIKQQAFLKRRAGHTPSRAGSLQPSTRPQNRNVRPGQEFLANLQESGAV